METVMKPFIWVYHFVHSIFLFPKRILEYAYSGCLAIVEKVTHKPLVLQKQHQQEVVDVVADLNLPLAKEPLQFKQMPSGKMTTFQYTVKNSAKQTIKGSFAAYKKEDAISYLTSEGYQVIKVEPRKFYEVGLFEDHKMSASQLSFALTQLSTYIKAGIPLIDSVRILAKQSTKADQRKVYDQIVYELLSGESFSAALTKQGKKFPKLLINMVKTAEMTGDLATTLDDMSDYYKAMDQTRKQMISAMTYPSIILLIAIGAVSFILAFVIPQFVEMFESQDAQLPGITLFVLNTSNLLTQKWYWILLVLAVVIFVYRSLYKNVKSFRKTMQTIFMKIPGIGKILIYNEVANFTQTFASLLNHSVFITDSMEILSQLTNNEVYKDIIQRTLKNLSKGAKISDAFRGEWAFPVVAYEMLVTGENTGQLGLMMEKVAEHYQMLHRNAVNQLKSLIEPIMIGFLAVVVGIIILSIIIPMFGIYGQVK